MKYTLNFYAIDLDEYRVRVADPKTHSRVLKEAKASDQFDEDELVLLSNILQSGLNGNWPELDTFDAFVAFDWLLETIAEPLRIKAFIEFNRWHYWTDTGLAETFTTTELPIIVPKFLTTENLGLAPHVGYLPHSLMQAVIDSPEPEGIPRTEGIRASRLDLIEVIESLYEEELDLIFVCFGDE